MMAKAKVMDAGQSRSSAIGDATQRFRGKRLRGKPLPVRGQRRGSWTSQSTRRTEQGTFPKNRAPSCNEYHGTAKTLSDALVSIADVDNLMARLRVKLA